MAHYTLHKAATRAHLDHGWLNSYQTFSFAGQYNPDRIRFGTLRVLNDDVIAGGRGFGEHPHDNMEIISIPLAGTLEHKDNMGNVKRLKAGEVQIMSTGEGVFHSEFNASNDEVAALLQIWVFPKTLNGKPRYEQITLDPSGSQRKLQQILSPFPDDDGAWIQQDAWFHLGHFEPGDTTHYTLHKKDNGLYAFVISGSFTVDGQLLEVRDGLGIAEISGDIALQAHTPAATILLMEIPMDI
ncbi:hypothetical protein GA0116948_10955 [Chitinophaga costaii]|uniref:Pirin N-terminal domain-containing protein n=1 Tax=Chitinophaga costaii TaxID=1335309 RepID=A0A1C4EN48_9BACT|nr:pirin family protein [Chitinophaga costaii]PUZ22459.1 pirin family protein [Chitinophaga costaii]SCC45038.1 hypothetical protein GA0116948_10955 [Chitinophaga costaii]